MKIPTEVIARHAVADGDTRMFVDAFDEPEGSKVLEVGAHDEPVANMLADCGFRMFGVDLRPYDDWTVANVPKRPACNYTYLQADFCDLPLDFLKEHLGTFDAIFSISAIEHFGLGTYKEGKPHTYYDVLAMRTAWQLLRENGVAYVTVPFGGRFIENVPHWRIYNMKALQERLIQDFAVDSISAAVVDRITIAGREYRAGDRVEWQALSSYGGDVPHISALLKLRKVPVNRLSVGGV